MVFTFAGSHPGHKLNSYFLHSKNYLGPTCGEQVEIQDVFFSIIISNDYKQYIKC